MISLELWRAKIGLFNCSRPPSSSLFTYLHHHQQSVAHGWFLAGGGSAGLFSSLDCRSLLIRRALVLLLVAVITHLLLSAGDVEENPGPIFRGAICCNIVDTQFIASVDDRPTILDLFMMKGADGKPLRIFETIVAGDLTTFGMCLLDDENGTTVDLIKKDHIHDGAKSVTRAILQQWLTSTVTPHTYQHLIKCLRQSELNALAEDIANQIEGKNQLHCFSIIIYCVSHE